MKKKKPFIFGAFLCFMVASIALNVNATISPTTLTATLNPGESVGETKTVDLPAEIPVGDIIFAFDLTGSMAGEIATAKAEAINIMNSLDALISDAQYGVMSYMDYPGFYSSYGYSALYGDAGSGDYAYSLDQPVTSDRPAVSAAINSLTLGWGADGPQDYTRIMYESYADPAVGWRSGSKRILINFGDAVPHDNDINEGVPGYPWVQSWGGDPGRDEVMFTGDDLDLQTVLADMAANYVTLLEVHSRGAYFDHWVYWTGLTGGAAYDLASPSGIPAAIVELIEAEAGFISTLTLETSPGYESWLTSVTPPSHNDLTLPTTVTFDIVVTVPAGTPPGTYTFTIWANGDGASYGEQEVTITVPGEGVPEIGFAAPISTSIAVAIYLFIKRRLGRREE